MAVSFSSFRDVQLIASLNVRIKFRQQVYVENDFIYRRSEHFQMIKKQDEWLLCVIANERNVGRCNSLRSTEGIDSSQNWFRWYQKIPFE